MSAQKDAYTIFEDQDDYVEDIKEQIRASIKRYTLYSKMFGQPQQWKYMKNDLKQYINYEIEKIFHQTVVRETKDGSISMRLIEDDNG